MRGSIDDASQRLKEDSPVLSVSGPVIRVYYSACGTAEVPDSIGYKSIHSRDRISVGPLVQRDGQSIREPKGINRNSIDIVEGQMNFVVDDKCKINGEEGKVSTRELDKNLIIILSCSVKMTESNLQEAIDVKLENNYKRYPKGYSKHRGKKVDTNTSVSKEIFKGNQNTWKKSTEKNRYVALKVAEEIKFEGVKQSTRLSSRTTKQRAEEAKMLALHTAIIKIDCVKLTSSSGRNKRESADEFGRTPLMMACFMRNFKRRKMVCGLLLDYGANIETLDFHNRNTIMYACATRNEYLLKRLLLFVDSDMNHTDIDGNTCLMYAAIEGDARILHMVVDKLQRYGLDNDASVKILDFENFQGGEEWMKTHYVERLKRENLHIGRQRRTKSVAGTRLNYNNANSWNEKR
eukprot:gene8187-9065_t